MQIGELKVRLGVDADTFKLKDFAHALGQIPFSVAAGISALTGMSFALTDMIKDSMNLGNNLKIFTSITGESGEELERWSSVAKKMGLDANTVKSSIMNLSSAFQQFKITGQVSESMHKGLAQLGMGFNPNADLFAFLSEAQQKAKNLGPRGAEALKMLGIDPSLIAMGALSRTQINQQGRAVLDQHGIDVYTKLWATLINFDEVVKGELVPAIERFIPAIGKFTDLMAHVIEKTGVHIADALDTALSQKMPKDMNALLNNLPLATIPTPYGPTTLSRAVQTILNVTNYITSMAPAHVLAEEIYNVVSRYHRRTTSYHNNGVQR